MVAIRCKMVKGLLRTWIRLYRISCSFANLQKPQVELDGKACAAAGQNSLMALYDALFSQVPLREYVFLQFVTPLKLICICVLLKCCTSGIFIIVFTFGRSVWFVLKSFSFPVGCDVISTPSDRQWFQECWL